MNTLVETFFAFISLAVVLLFLPEIIGFGILCAAAFYLVAFITGFTKGKKLGR